MGALRVLVEIFQAGIPVADYSEQDWPVASRLAVDHLWGSPTFSQGSGVQRFKRLACGDGILTPVAVTGTHAGNVPGCFLELGTVLTCHLRTPLRPGSTVFSLLSLMPFSQVLVPTVPVSVV